MKIKSIIPVVELGSNVAFVPLTPVPDHSPLEKLASSRVLKSIKASFSHTAVGVTKSGVAAATTSIDRLTGAVQLSEEVKVRVFVPSKPSGLNSLVF